MSEDTSTTATPMDTTDITDDSSEMLASSHFATKPDGSLIDPVNSEGDCLVSELAMPDGTSPQDPPDSVPQPAASRDPVEPAVTGDDSHTTVPRFTLGGESAGIEGEVVDGQMVDPKREESLTPVKDHFDVPKSLPESGMVTPASQSDQSLTCSSSEKGTPNTRFKLGDLRHLDYDSMSSSSGSVKNLQLPQRLGISWRKGERLEAMDYLNSWFPAKIRSINEDDMKVLIHFDGWNQRYDEWIDMSSDRIRPLVRHSERKERSKRARSTSGSGRGSAKNVSKKPLKEHKIGDAVYAKWTDCKMYPAKITNIMPNGAYEVIFYDGFKKLVQPINVRSMPKEYRQKSFEIDPVPEAVCKKAKLKLDCTDHSLSQPDIQDVRSGEKVKLEAGGGRESSTDSEKKQPRTKKRRLIVPGLFSDASVTGLGESVTPDVQIKSEPVSTQTDYGEGSKIDNIGVPGTSAGQIMGQPQVPTPVAPIGVLPPKAFVVESDHNQYKCQYQGCNKSFRKEHLLDYHIKYYHINGDTPLPTPAKRRRKTTSTCSTESESIVGGKKLAAKKNRNFSAEGAMFMPDLKQEFPEVPDIEETGEIPTQTSHSKHTESYASDDFVQVYGMKQDSLEESSVTDAEEFLKPDELVNCICDFQEENGLMIQCEVCMCWQHAACFGITERTLPKTYICFVCENPPGVRESSKYIHEQDWFKTGEIPSFSFLPLPPMSEERCSTVKSTHTLVVELQQLNAVLHSLKLQLKVLRTKDESKLKMWRADWDVLESETFESFALTTDDKNGFIKDGIKAVEIAEPQAGSSKDCIKEPQPGSSKDYSQEPQPGSSKDYSKEPQPSSSKDYSQEPQAGSSKDYSKEPQPGCSKDYSKEPQPGTSKDCINVGETAVPIAGCSKDYSKEPQPGTSRDGINAGETAIPQAGSSKDFINSGETAVPQAGSSKDGIKAEVGETGVSQVDSSNGDVKAEETAVSKAGSSKECFETEETTVPQNGSSKDSMAVGEITVPQKQIIKIENEEEVKTEIKAETSCDTNKVIETVKTEEGVSEVKVEDKEDESQSSTTTGDVLNNPVKSGTEEKEVLTTDNGHEEIKDEAQSMMLENNTGLEQEVIIKVEETGEENHSDSTESVIEDPIEVCERNLLSHILRVQAEISDRFDKIQEQIEMLEAMEAMQSRRELPNPQNVLNDMPQLKRSLRNTENDLCKVKKMSVFH
ncbi:uncharacterized protein LOC132716672 [Ruditapes philippinarum]|uniref:uncharacterized protein LOC132716672 n=1 Tax=Ruditapes philippinarum TaxID=129788 RepID=UPI00295B1ACF|nr:uncharacterized protein LOC132716672 [Ruditapes philippinarum]